MEETENKKSGEEEIRAVIELTVNMRKLDKERKTMKKIE